jgi:hypothetical protein
MNIPVPLARRIAIAALVLFALLLVLHWRPSHQVRLHQDHLLRAVENRKWKMAGEFMAEDYKDSWEQTKPVVLARLPQIFSDFLACGVIAENTSLTWTNGEPAIQSQIHIVGSGGPIAQLVMEESKHLSEPYSFKWRRQSWKPWDWKLIEVSQPQLRMTDAMDWQP